MVRLTALSLVLMGFIACSGTDKNETGESGESGESATQTCPDEGASATSWSTCAELEPDFAAELAHVQCCEVDSDCGQAISGTSCGCTRDLVARADADLTTFNQILSDGSSMGCELIGDSTCDCPEADGFACIENVCTWNYVGAP